jgi:hypothetical protein
MISRPTHSRVIMPAAITGRDSTARYSAMSGLTAAWRAMAQGGPHQEAMAISLPDLDCSLQMSCCESSRHPGRSIRIQFQQMFATKFQIRLHLQQRGARFGRAPRTLFH